MPVQLRRGSETPERLAFDTWVHIPAATSGEPRLNPERRRHNLAEDLEKAFDAEAETWWALGRELSAEPSAGLAHGPAAVANASDLGLMLAWTRLVRAWTREEVTTLVVCDDPWLFRHLATISGVTAGRAPPLAPVQFRLWARGLAARSVASLRFMLAAACLRDLRRAVTGGAATLVVYGHPSSTADGIDGYFGDLMRELPQVCRMLHVDCPPDRAIALAADGRTSSLHGFGSAAFAMALPFARWRPTRAQSRGPHGWLVRRAAAREGGTAQAAAIRWQLHCQERWLHRCRPVVIAWPWENHSWERAFVRTARQWNIRTIGYQHSVIGRQMLNYAPHSNLNGTADLPDRVFCSGAATRDQLLKWGVPEDRLAVAGTLRFHPGRGPAWDAAAPVFVALPFDPNTAGEMVGCLRDCARNGTRFVVKDHPMTPFAFDNSEGVERTRLSLAAQPAVSAVIYAATTVGLEAVLAGLPTIRFRPRGRIALDILPDGIRIPTAESDTLAGCLSALSKPGSVDTAYVFALANRPLWRSVLGPSEERFP